MSVLGAAPRVIRRWGGWPAVPAALVVLAVLGVGVTIALAQSFGLLPLFGRSMFSLDAWAMFWSSSSGRASVLISLVQATASSALAVVVGTSAALLVRGASRGSRLLDVVLRGPLTIPHLAVAGVVALAFADSGLLSRLLAPLGIGTPTIVDDRVGVGVVLSYSWKESAFVAVVVMAALASGELRGREEQLATLGATPRSVLRHVTLPAALPAIAVSGAVAFAFVVGAYEVPALLAGLNPEPLPSLAYRRFTSVDLGSRPQAQVAALTAALLALIGAAGIVAGARWLVRHGVRR